MKITLTAPFLALLASISVTIATPIHTGAEHNIAPLLSSATTAEHEIPNNYIVVFKKDVKPSKASDHHSWVASMHTSSITAELKKRSQDPLTPGHASWMDEIEAMVGLKHTYHIPGGLMGYSGAFDDQTLKEIRSHPDVSLTLGCSGCPIASGCDVHDDEHAMPCSHD